MDALSPQEIEKLVLGYEELDPADRTVADRYLASQPELTARLQWHQGREALSNMSLPVSDQAWTEDSLSQAEAEAQQESLRRILAALDQAGSSGQAPAGKILSFGDRLRRQALWVLPLAAILAMVVLLPRGFQEKVLLQNLSVAQIELMADGTRGPTEPVPTGGQLHTGQAFAIDFSLVEDSYVVIYHVDPQGQVSRVYPETITDALVPLSGGQGHQIPPIDSGEAWVLGNETGTESFLVIASKTLPTDLQDLQPDPALTIRQDILAYLLAQLKTLDYQVDLYEFEHVD